MKIEKARHRWDLTPQQALNLQKKLAHQINIKKSLPPDQIKIVAGADVSTYSQEKLNIAIVVVLSFPDLEIIEKAIAQKEVTFPYVPGLLSFREGPVLLKAFEKVKHKPDLILFDGQGLAHPRRYGLACHIGWWLGIPSIGVAKTRLIGKHKEVGKEKGAWKPLFDHSEQIGSVLRTRDNVKPIYVSPGYQVDHKSARGLTLACTPRYRLPEPIRWAHRLGKEVKK